MFPLRVLAECDEQFLVHMGKIKPMAPLLLFLQEHPCASLKSSDCTWFGIEDGDCSGFKPSEDKEVACQSV